MKRSCDRTSVEIHVSGVPDGVWWDALSSEQRNTIRARIDSICDDLNAWVPA